MRFRNLTDEPPAGPPPEAYSRVTNAERFEGLHRLALEKADQLTAAYDVRRVDPYTLDKELMSVALARPPLRLEPADANGAPITIALTAFPGLFVRFGRFTMHTFPVCGCDACAETVEGETRRFIEHVNAVVAGRFAESLVIPWFGEAKQTWSFRPDGGSHSGGTSLDRKSALALVGDGPRVMEWKAWRPRNSEFGDSHLNSRIL